jgi:BCD family chlorophyll transporter-like MFS transporter
MYVMQLLGMIFSALIFADLLSDYSPARLIRVVQAAAVLTLVLNVIALWKQEARSSARKPGASAAADESFTAAWTRFCQGPHTVRRLVGLGLGTMAFTMQDVLLEPYGGEVLLLSVSQTTFLTATLALGGLMGFAAASHVLGRGADPYRMACWGAALGLPGFAAVLIAATLHSTPVFVGGAFLIGVGGGLFAHGTLTASMQSAPPGQVGLALGAWGAVQATAAGLAMVLGGLLREWLVLPLGLTGAYATVWGLEQLMLLGTLVAMLPLARKPRSGA